MRSFSFIIATIAATFTVATAEAKIVHRWSFDKDTADYVGGAHGKLHDGAAVREGKVIFDGQNYWAELPIGKTIEKLSSATFEAWFTWDELQGPWARIFDIGNTETSNMFFTTLNGTGDKSGPNGTPRFAITTSGGLTETRLTAKQRITAGKLTHVAITIDPEKQIGTLYIDGKEAASGAMTLKPSDLGRTTQNLIGISRYTADPLFHGSISEFRIYDNALSAEEVELSFKEGPDKLVEKTEADGKGPESKTTPATGEEKKSADKTDAGK